MNLSVLKSTLQKAVRRNRSDVVFKVFESARELKQLFLFFRRLPIIQVEETFFCDYTFELIDIFERYLRNEDVNLLLDRAKSILASVAEFGYRDAGFFNYVVPVQLGLFDDFVQERLPQSFGDARLDFYLRFLKKNGFDHKLFYYGFNRYKAGAYNGYKFENVANLDSGKLTIDDLLEFPFGVDFHTHGELYVSVFIKNYKNETGVELSRDDAVRAIWACYSGVSYKIDIRLGKVFEHNFGNVNKEAVVRCCLKTSRFLIHRQKQQTNKNR